MVRVFVCKWCGGKEFMQASQECGRCNELRSRIEHDPALAETMLKSMRDAKRNDDDKQERSELPGRLG